MRDCEGNGSNAMVFVAGALVGAAAGALAGVLLAPRSGKETRAQLHDTAEEWAEKACRAAEQARHAAEAALKQARHAAAEGQDMAEHEIEAAKAAWRAGREAWQRQHGG